MTDLIITRALRLCLLMAAHEAKRDHKPVSDIMAKLRAVTAQVAVMEIYK